MSYRVFCLLFMILQSFAGCKKVVSVDLKDNSGQIVIEGEVIEGKQTSQVRISRSVAFSSSNDFPPVSGAVVIISDTDKQKSFTLTEVENGLYVTSDVRGTALHTYRLSVMVDGSEYLAFSTMPSPVAMDSVTFAQNVDYSNHKDINAIVNFQDPVGVSNYYRFIEYLNGVQIPNTFVFEDRLSDGRYIKEPLFNDSTYLHRGDTLVLKMYCVDKSDYLYFYSLTQATADGSTGYMSATPANPVTNLSNGALGYFSAHTSMAEEMIVY